MSLISFFVAMVAAVWAVEMYRLLRAGEGGKAWRVLVVASVVFAVHELYALGRSTGIFQFEGIAEATGMMFAALLAYAFYTQRRAFLYPQSHRAAREGRKSPLFRERLPPPAGNDEG
ncbi:MAG: hypothetical protein NZT92_18845 [Abditibacteriales bacterium]|nr:hypothetical protein [Abditibacteriales bacterium]MDW8367834.1 hypothetical protein [Abditibacteriales bacterium]